MTYQRVDFQVTIKADRRPLSKKQIERLQMRLARSAKAGSSTRTIVVGNPLGGKAVCLKGEYP